MKKFSFLLIVFFLFSIYGYCQKALANYDGNYDVNFYWSQIGNGNKTNSKRVNFTVEISSETKTIKLNAGGVITTFKLNSRPKITNLINDDGMPYQQYYFRAHYYTSMNNAKNVCWVNLLYFPSDKHFNLGIQYTNTSKELQCYQFSK